MGKTIDDIPLAELRRMLRASEKYPGPHSESAQIFRRVIADREKLADAVAAQRARKRRRGSK
jgi:hypothetical protein